MISDTRIFDTDLVAGVDGGNSKTIALVARRDGTIIGHGRAGCSDIYGAASRDAALAETCLAVSAAAYSARNNPDRLGIGVFSMAGADWPEDIDFLTAAFRARGLAGHVRVVNDSLGALRAGSRTGTGVCVVCGTGAAIGARNERGQSWHTSWWQQPQGSRHLAQQVRRAVYRAELEIDPPTSLTGRVLDVYGLDQVEDVLHLETRREGSPPDVSGVLTAALLEEAVQGDVAALRIVRDHGSSLGDYASAAARAVDLEGEGFELVLSGGVLRHSTPILRDAIVASVRSRSPGACAVRSTFEPAVGALMLALEGAGTVIDETVLGHLRASMPPPELFST